MSAYFMVRARTNDIFNQIFIKQSVVGVGWSDVNFASLPDPQAVHNAVYNVYFKNSAKSASVIGKACNAAARFKGIKTDDLIIVPRPSAIVLATATKDEIYDSSLLATFDTANLHKVEYKLNEKREVLEIPRSSLSQGLQSRLRAQGSSVLDLGEFANEINYIFKYNENAYTQAFNDLIIEKSRKAHEDLLSNIQKGKTRLQAGGEGFEKLIEVIFNALGYSANRLSKNKFSQGIDADIEAVLIDQIFGERNILIQVKHHIGTSGDTGIQQLIGALQTPEYVGYSGIFITSADNVDQNAIQLAQANNITILLGEDVVNLIFGNYEKLKEIASDILVDLGIFNTTQLFYY